MTDRLTPVAAGSAGQRQSNAWRSWLWAVLLAAGFVVPLARFWPWLVDHGFDIALFVQTLFANPVSAFFAWDVILAVLTLVVLALLDRELPAWQRVLVGLASLLGASVGLPLYGLLRERRRSSPVATHDRGGALAER